MSIRLTSASSQYLRGDASTLSFNSAYTILFSAYLVSDTNNHADFVVVDTIYGSAEVDFLITNSNGTQLYLGVDPGGGRTTGADLSTGTWYNLALVRSSNADLRMYRNGTQEGSTLTNSVAARASGRYLYIGTWFASAYYPDARIANVKIFNRALTGAQLIAEHASLRPVSTTDLWAWYPMSGNALADCLLDKSGNGRHLTAFNTPTVEDGPPIAWGAPVLASPPSVAESVPTVTLTGTVTMSADRPVAAPVVTTVTLTVNLTALEVGTSATATVVVRDQNGDPMSGETVTWSSTNAGVIAAPASGTTNSSGTVAVLLTALTAGSTSIEATCSSVDSNAVVMTVAAVSTDPGYSATGSTKVVVNCSSVVKRMGRARVRRFSDAEQRVRDATDTAFSRVKDNVERQVVWPSKELLRRYL